MSTTFIGLDRCARCGGGSSPCPVCCPVEEEPPRGHKYCRFCDRVAFFYEGAPGRCADCRKARQKAAYRLNPQPQRDRVNASYVKKKQS